MDDRPLVMASANQAWNLVNFRGALLTALVARGYRVIAVAPADPGQAAKLEAMGCEFEPLAIDAAGISPLRDAQLLVRYVALMRRHRPDVFLGWTIKPNVYGSIAARLTGCAALPNVSGLGTAFIRRNLLTLVAKTLYRLGFAKADAVLFQNADDRREFIEQRLVRADQTRLLPGSGIDTARFAVPYGGARPPGRRFLMISRLIGDKGVREFVAAARMVRERHPALRLVLLGFAEVANRTAIRPEELAAWVEEGAIEYQPPLDDVRPAIAAAECVVLPSYREGMSRILLEAAAMGRPAVTTDVPGCRDIVVDAVTGFLCPPRDAAGLAAALERAAELDDERWRAMAAAARQRIVESFSAERIIEIYLELLSVAGFPPSEASAAGSGKKNLAIGGSIS